MNIFNPKIMRILYNRYGSIGESFNSFMIRLSVASDSGATILRS